MLESESIRAAAWSSSMSFLPLERLKGVLCFDSKGLVFDRMSPVIIGSFTDYLGIISGALSSTLLLSSYLIGPCPSIGLPTASTAFSRSPSPIGTSTIAPVLLTQKLSLSEPAVFST